MLGFLKDFFTNSIPLFKNSRDFRHLLYVHPMLVMVMFDMVNYCNERNMPFKVTSLIRTPQHNISIGSTSSTHPEGRAFDMSVRGWQAYDIGDFVDHFNRKYKDIAAISSSTRKPTLVVYHVGTAEHLHIQINPKYSMGQPWRKL